MTNNIITWKLLFLSGGVGSFVTSNYESLLAQLIVKIIMTTIALLVATTVVFFYKKWLEK